MAAAQREIVPFGREYDAAAQPNAKGLLRVRQWTDADAPHTPAGAVSVRQNARRRETDGTPERRRQ